MAEATSTRLDTVDIAGNSGWEIDSTSQRDLFTKADATIEVLYSAEDTIDKAVKRLGGGEIETLDSVDPQNVDRLRSWLTGRPANPAVPARDPEADFTAEAGGWTRQEFVAAVEDPGDRAFLLRFLELMDVNGQLPALGTHSRLHFGKRPSGAVFVYPFGRRFPPFKFSVKDGRLMISGCWKGNFKVTGHPGFAEIGSLLGQDEKGPASAVATAGLDPDEV